MRRMSRSLLIVASLLLLSCGKGDEDEPRADYSVLGITSVTINGQRLILDGATLLDVRDIPSISVVGIDDQMTQKKVELSYAVLTQPGASLSIQVESRHADVSIVVDDELETDRGTYTVVVNRKGYEEQVTYVFYRTPVA